MENLTIVSCSASSPKLLIGCNFTSSLKPPVGFSRRTPKVTLRCSKISASVQSQAPSSRPEKAGEIVAVKHRSKAFASIFSSNRDQQTTSVAYPTAPVPPPSSSTIGSPLFWIGVGVGLSALFSWVTSSLKKYAMQTAMKTMMNQMNTQNSQFNNPGFPTGSGSGSPFPFPFPPQTSPTSSPFQSQSQYSGATVDVTATKVDTPPSTKPQPTPVKDIEVDKPSVVLEENKAKKEEKNYAFEDVSPEETTKESPFSNYAEVSETNASEKTRLFEDVLQNGATAAPANGATASEVFQSLGAGKGGPGLSVEALEKMMEDPTVQKMVYPHLPEEMRNPETFKWMLKNPQYRQQLQDMLNNMSGSGEWDKRMMDTLKNFDLNSPEVKQQFDQIGLTPEEVISKIMENPDVAMAFQNPRVQAALMECSENPMNIMKYQNDKEVMDVFNKISQLFPGMTG
uniref:Protein TIC 40, chloroplastic n=1 Tax=Noccaea caerulescens TaxID=107243 RepID=A0A1J3I136_NOCCA